MTDLIVKLEKRLQDEFKEFTEKELTKNADEIFNDSYQIIIKQDLANNYSSCTNLDKRKIQQLLAFGGNTLDFLYSQWMDSSVNTITADVVSTIDYVVNQLPSVQ